MSEAVPVARDAVARTDAPEDLDAAGAGISQTPAESRRRVWRSLRGGPEQSSPGELDAVWIRPGSNVLSFDVEAWAATPCVDDTTYLLELLREKGSRATFFVLGSVASREPDLVRRIASEGHEIASHGWDHEPIDAKSPSRFRVEMERSFELLSSLVRTPVAGFRAPHFSMGPDTYWALDVLAETGFLYDSSIFPIAGRRYGVPAFPRRPVRVTRNGRSLVEVPLSTVRRLGRNLPVAGGGYFRLLPYWLIERAVRVVNDEGLPFVGYCHPYEFRRENLVCSACTGVVGHVQAAARGAKFNFLRRTMRTKLSRLLDTFRFTTIQEALRDELRT